MLRALLVLLATGAATAFTVPTSQRTVIKLAPGRPLSRVIARSDPVKQEFDPDLIPDSSAEAADDFYSLENNGLDGERARPRHGRGCDALPPTPSRAVLSARVETAAHAPGHSMLAQRRRVSPWTTTGGSKTQSWPAAPGRSQRHP